MKIAIAGKGGVGKSTLSALTARILYESGHKVLLIDADPDMNLASILGIPKNTRIVPVSELKELIAERTGTQVNKSAAIFIMNPKVDDIPDKYCISHKGIKLLTMGTIRKGGGGCACPENAFLKNLLSHLIISRNEWVILDMEAGIEHLGRGTALGVDRLCIIVEPSHTSVSTAFRINKLAADIGIKKIGIIGNKIQSKEDEYFILNNLNNFEILGILRHSDEIHRMNTEKISLFNIKGDILAQIKDIIKAI